MRYQGWILFRRTRDLESITQLWFEKLTCRYPHSRLCLYHIRGLSYHVGLPIDHLSPIQVLAITRCLIIFVISGLCFNLMLVATSTAADNIAGAAPDKVPSAAGDNSSSAVGNNPSSAVGNNASGAVGNNASGAVGNNASGAAPVPEGKAPAPGGSGASLPEMKVPAESSVSNSKSGGSKFNLNANSTSFELGTSELVVAWEEWHHRIGKLLSKKINHAIGEMLGTATVQIKIDYENKLTAELLESTGSKQFGPKCLEAALSLDGNPALAFPSESKRKSVTFNYKFKRKLFTIPSMKFIKDDYEKVGD